MFHRRIMYSYLYPCVISKKKIMCFLAIYLALTTRVSYIFGNLETSVLTLALLEGILYILDLPDILGGSMK